jgi:hypothetical protein
MMRLKMGNFPKFFPLALLIAMLGLPRPGLAGDRAGVGPTSYGPGSMAGPMAAPARQAVARYGREIDQQLFNQFGLGTNSRNVYCYGPAIIRFQVTPSGIVRDVKLLRQSLPNLNAYLVAKLSNTRMPKFYSGMPDRPYTKIFRYGVAPFAEFHFNAEKLACR